LLHICRFPAAAPPDGMQYSCKNAGRKQKCSNIANLYKWGLVSPSEDNGETVHDRVFMIRQALGENRRKPMSQKAFADLLNEKAEAMEKECRFEETMIGRIETKRVPTTEEADVIAAVDPLDRGRAWLAWGETRGIVLPDPAKDRKLTMEEIQRAARQVERDNAAQAQKVRATARKRGRS
jgi:hypothetical protein